MKAVEKAIWFIERNYNQHISLDDLAQVTGTSRFYLSRAFVYTTGISISRYLRDRRLSQAARVLASGKNDILDLALSIGYGSHEAFSRAFKSKFGYTPENVRAQGHTNNLFLMEALNITVKETRCLSEPVIVKSSARLLTGLSRKYTNKCNNTIPNQWIAFSHKLGSISNQTGNDTFGVIYNIDDEENFEYTCAIEVSSFNGLDDNFSRLRLPEQVYAVFQHNRHVSKIKMTCVSIWRDWLPDSVWEPVDSPFFERYTKSYNTLTGSGGLEVWLPVKSAN